MRKAKPRQRRVLLLLLVVLFPISLWAQNLEIHYINVGWGGAVLVKGPDGTTILLEGGDTGDGLAEVVPYLQSIGIQPADGLDYTIAGHQHCDHIGGLDEVMNAGYDVHFKNYFNGSTYTSTCATELSAAAAATTAGALEAMPVGTEILLGNGAKLTCVARNGSIIGGGSVAVSNENDRSIAVLIQYGGFDFLWASDLGGGSIDQACTGRSTSQVDVESSVIQAISPGGAFPLISAGGIDVLHCNHHGSESSTNQNWMNLSQPAVAIISVGDGQSVGWNLPRKDVVENVLLAQASSCITAPAADVFQTEDGSPSGATTSFAGYAVGNITITTDGLSTFTVSADGAVNQGANELAASGLPKTYNLDDAAAPPDVTPPVISNVHEEGVTASGADIVWDTDENATSVVKYGTSPGTYATTITDPTLVLAHRVTLSGLTAATAYFYLVESADMAGNTAGSAEHTFTTSSGGGGASNVVISEVFYDTPGTDSQEEWVELYNPGATAVDISGWTITDNNGTGATITLPAGKTIAPGTYFTIAANQAGFFALYGYDADVYGSLPALNNTGDALLLSDAGGVEIDAVAWEGGASAGVPAGWGSTTEPNAPTGSSIFRTDPNTDTGTFADWSVTANNGNPQTQPPPNVPPVANANGPYAGTTGQPVSFSSAGSSDADGTIVSYLWDFGDGGTSTAANPTHTYAAAQTYNLSLTVTDNAGAQASDATTATISAPSAASVLISEVFYDTPGTDSKEEWVELYNASGSTVDLGGWSLTDDNGFGATFTIPGGNAIAPATHFTIAANRNGFKKLYGYNADITGGLPSLNNTGDALVLRDGAGLAVDAVAWEGGAGNGIPAGWGSTTEPNAATGNSIVRTSPGTDTDTYADWTIGPNNGNPQTQSGAGGALVATRLTTENRVMLGNYPNPFNPSTEIRYTLLSNGRVTLRIYNVMGQLVTTLVDAYQSPGDYAVRFDASHLASGTYYYQLHANGEVRTRTMFLEK